MRRTPGFLEMGPFEVDTTPFRVDFFNKALQTILVGQNVLNDLGQGLEWMVITLFRQTHAFPDTAFQDDQQCALGIDEVLLQEEIGHELGLALPSHR